MSGKTGQEAWHLDRRIPLALIASILLQTAAVAWYFATLDGRVTALEREGTRQAAGLATATRSVHAVEMSAAGRDEKLNAILRAISRIERQVSRRLDAQ